MSKKQFLEKRIIIPFYMELLKNDTEENAEMMTQLRESIINNIKNVYEDDHEDDDVIQKD